MRKLAVAVFILFVLAVCTFTAHADNPDDPLVVNTNWTIDEESGIGFFNPGIGVDPDPGRPDYIPAYNDYDWMYTDNKAVRHSTLQGLLASWNAYCQPEIEGVDVLNRIEDLQTGINRIQIVVNHVVLEGLDRIPTNSMFTIIFPPYFSVDAQNRYPVSISATGYGSLGLNESIFVDLPLDLIKVKEAYLFDENNRGIVGVRWNTGGYLSMGVNDDARYALNEMFQLLHNQYGCDKHKIVASGASRAGFAALTIAQNVTPQVYDYTCIAVFSRGSALALGKLSEFPVATFPAFASTYNVNVGSGAFRYTYDPPGGMNPDLLIPAFGAETDDGMLLVEKANRMSPDHPDNLQALQGKYVFLAYAAHDAFAPLTHFLDMDNWLSNHGLEHTTFISLQGGHGTTAGDIANTILKDFFDYLLNDENFVPGDYSPPKWKHGLFENGRNYLLDTDITNHGSNTVMVDLDEIPFSLTMPYRLGCDVFGDGTPGVANEPGILILTGRDGKEWEVSVRSRKPDDTYSTPHTWSGTFDQTEGEIIKWWPGRLGWDDFPVTASGTGMVFHPGNDWLEWTVTYDGIDYSSFTNWKLGGQRLADETEILSSQAWSDQMYANYTLEGDGSTAFGVDAIPALPWVDLTCSPVSGTAPVGITCALTAGCYAPVDRTLAYSVDITLADGTVLPAHWEGTMAIGPDESETHFQLYEYYDESCIGVNTYAVTVADVTPAPFNQPPFPPSGLTSSTSSIVTITAPISDPVRQQQWLLNWDPGWTASGGWGFGQPEGLGGANGGPDPDAGWTGNNTYGYNLSGDYPNNLLAEHLTSTVFNCTGLTETRLKFWRWLGVEDPGHDHASVGISADGGPWVTVWENSTEIVDTSWVLMDIDISAVADDRASVRVRWTMGLTDGANTFCGWNIDDVEIWAKQSIVPAIIDDVSCIPSSGTVPFSSHMKYTVSNTCDSHRRVATQVDVDLASGTHISNWKRGYQNISPQTVAITQWNQTLPALGFVIGDNIFTFKSRDVTPPPYNQPPHTPSGSTSSDVCMLTGIAP